MCVLPALERFFRRAFPTVMMYSSRGSVLALGINLVCCIGRLGCSCSGCIYPGGNEYICLYGDRSGNVRLHLLWLQHVAVLELLHLWIVWRRVDLSCVPS